MKHGPNFIDATHSVGEITRIRRNAVILVVSVVIAIIVFTLFYAIQPRDNSNEVRDEVVLDQRNESNNNGLPHSMFDVSYDDMPSAKAGEPADFSGMVADGNFSPEQMKEYQDALQALKKQKQETNEQLAAMRQLQAQLQNQQIEEARKALDSPISYVNYALRKSRQSDGTEKDTDNTVDGSYPDIGKMVSDATSAMVSASQGMNGGNLGTRSESPDEAFMRNGEFDTETYQVTHVTPVLSKFDLSAGTFIPGALITGINTDLPGVIVGKITQNVYDSTTGKYLLIPQGTNVVGEYQSLIANGQSRALVVWHTLTMPNGTSIPLGGAPGTDASGFAGLSDHTDFHIDSMIATTAITTGLGFLANSVSSSSDDDISILGDTLAQESLQLGQSLIDRALAHQPTITIRPGWTFNIVLRKNVSLAPYKS
ncbi:Type IV secretion system protein PtlG [Poriferisphaera corsica]|uniref:Type IV secretion system protein PtlG n=1 Tax=Poriferisphaera corsica TaxID=2528020 RepID=A0A517YSP6_9BACT|nr:TrbI/VirB10 family protein [Poriferisphaera corsica]QDU33259.1 Type IV secretion system protein PtlG [Poriferisphaera corsica]